MGNLKHCEEAIDCSFKSPTNNFTTRVIISLISIIFILLVILLTIFVSERVRIWLYHNKFFSKFFRGENDSQFDSFGNSTFDAFISYAEPDADFVEKMTQVLESPS